jgi:hypothetical protein
VARALHRSLVLAFVVVVAVLSTATGWAHLAAPAPKKFSHRDHVQEAWLDVRTNEVFRDCRGCHRFSKDQLVSAPQQECDACHAGTGVLERQFAEGFDKDLRGNTTRTRAAFRHHTHGMLECRECHLPTYTDALFDDFDVRTGPGQCARCHEAGRAAAAVASMRFFAGAADPALAQALGIAPFVPPADDAARAALASRLDAVFAGPEGGLNTTPLPPGGDFDHGDHLAIGCVDCHSGVRTAGPEGLGTADIAVAGCKQCHIGDAAGTALAASSNAREVERPSWSLRTFSHADHFGFTRGAARKQGVCSEAAYDALAKADACAECHRYAPAVVGLSARDFPFDGEQSRHRYRDCIGCHDVLAWQTGETAAQPLHASSGQGPNGWQRCTECHVFGQGPMASTRPAVEVQRWTGRTFSFPANTHPDITQRGIERGEREGRLTQQDCRDCHRARVPEVASRLGTSNFRHETHLPRENAEASCAECHPSAAAAADARSLADAGFRTYTLDGCTKCHWGGDVKEQVAPAERPAARAVVAFPHGPHVQKHGLACTECHALAADGGDVVTKAEAASCAQCHDHVAGGSTYEGLFDGKAQSCARCHHDDPAPAVAAVPAVRGTPAARRDPHYTKKQREFGGFARPQFHPAGSQCTDCHKANVDPADAQRLVAINPPVRDHVMAEKKASFHQGAGASEPPECLRCHWKPANNWRPAVDVARGTQDELQFRRAPESRATRAKFGNLFDGYPGDPRAKG